MTNSTSIYTPIAAEFAKQAWQWTGTVLAHGLMALSAYGIVDFANRPQPSKEKTVPSFARKVFGLAFNLLNPFPKLKKWLLFASFEISALFTHGPFSHTWKTLAPIAEKFMTPIIETGVRPLLNFLKEKGFITLTAMKDTIPDTAKNIAKVLMKQDAGENTVLEQGIETVRTLAKEAAGSQAAHAAKNFVPSSSYFSWYSPGDWAHKTIVIGEYVYSWPKSVIEQWQGTGAQAAAQEAAAQAAKEAAAQAAKEAAAQAAKEAAAQAAKEAAERIAKETAERVAKEAAEKLAKEAAKGQFEKLYQFADRSAPEVGKFVANGIETSYDYATRFVHYPSSVIKALAEATGLPPYVVGIGALVVGAAALYGITNGFSRVTQTVTQLVDTKSDAKAKASSHAAANGNNVQVIVGQDEETKSMLKALLTMFQGTRKAESSTATSAERTEDRKKSTLASSTL